MNVEDQRTEVHIAYLVCATPRSGSSLLCEALWNTDVAGRPDEYFRPARLAEPGSRHGDLGALCHAILQQGMTPNGVTGAKIMWGDLERFVIWIAERGLRGHPTVWDAASWFPPLKYIWITRRDKLRQAISLSKAAQSNIWRIEDGPPPSGDQECVFRVELVDDYVRVLTQHDDCWRRFFASQSLDPLVITYEELVAHYEQTVRRALHYIDPFSPHGSVPPARLVRQANAQSEDWVRRYHQRGLWMRVRLWRRGRRGIGAKI